MEEGSPMIPAGGSTVIQFTPKPSGLHWYHTHAMAHRDLKRGLYSGQFGVLHVDPASGDPGRYDQEQFIVLHDWEPYYAASNDGSMMVNYVCGIGQRAHAGPRRADSRARGCSGCCFRS